MKYRYIGIAGALALSVLLSGCSGSSESSGSSQTSGSAEVVSGTETSQPEESTAPVDAYDLAPAASTAETAPIQQPEVPAEETEEIPAAQTTESPAANVDYPADWLYGTWSTLTLNGYDYWEYADEQGIDGEVQLIFSSDGVKVTRGSEGVVDEFSYTVTDSGVAITDKESGDTKELTYDPAADTLSFAKNNDTVVYIRGTNPRYPGAESHVGEGIYGLWSVVTLNGEDFWTSDRMVPEQSGESFIEINESGLRTIDNYGTDYYEMRLTDTGAEFTTTRDGEDYVLTYDETSDTITAFQKSQPDGDTMVMKRGSNPKPGTQSDCGWLYGTWSAVTVNGQEFWTYAQENGIDFEWQLVFSSDTCFAIAEDTYKTSYTVDGNTVTVLSGVSTSQTAMYNSSTDMLMLNDEQAGQTIVMKRGTNPRS
ncbi:MAG: hypothetical protein ACI4WS_10315 [Oscillospiraceae bacterium]